MTREQEEYRALRATIRERGTARVCLFAAGMAAWAALAVASLALALPPLATIIPLLVLASTFEVTFALHAGVERLGRYLLVFHGDTWEQTAGSFGQPPGAVRLDALFTWVFLGAATANLMPLLVTVPVVQELAAVGLAHLVFVLRVLSAGRAARLQRDVDRRRFAEVFTEIVKGIKDEAGA
jgi:hypothetical protein